MSGAYRLAEPLDGLDFAAVLASRDDVRLSAVNPGIVGRGPGAHRGNWSLATLVPSMLHGWWWIGVNEYGGSIVATYGFPQAGSRIPSFLTYMGVPAATFTASPAAALDYCPWDPPASARPVDRRSVYFISPVGGGLIKIGVAGDVAGRLESLQTGSPVLLEVRAVITDGGEALELSLHKRFAASRRHGEWFEPTPELLALIEESAT